ncbi:Transcription factor of the ATF/CREB family [Komagataella phaffii CBS 7435]|uniref:Basic leucine zipper (BZIP) transcription factor of the ATF/CREB family, activates transcription of n=2 Tax=Komagataella phaffii TaxID=460519 RepID=C4R3M8_KOMPG|nr:Basic leucine zipper (bZIP) transcription factor of the ATF/CREB family, activates transcription of [Komagataella phaffii GS115]AOA63660.1 GQ67_03152T0 [Komagataella phaffii]CAH2450177.1 Transcription factor of the ATF/CREB family [Komagataella phaffii CBS 7435]AOA68965.1 GQ68_03137T0 [Komagataella phaffii GS115]CAY70078.1 Basic leucine zipper (bZIP) transcription factor of the ATF/CREB family, activates transcription of [Komagataella phaffii GS115]CCA40045.1 Transcription factor of the ATF
MAHNNPQLVQEQPFSPVSQIDVNPRQSQGQIQQQSNTLSSPINQGAEKSKKSSGGTFPHLFNQPTFDVHTMPPTNPPIFEQYYQQPSPFSHPIKTPNVIGVHNSHQYPSAVSHAGLGFLDDQQFLSMNPSYYNTVNDDSSLYANVVPDVLNFNSTFDNDGIVPSNPQFPTLKRRISISNGQIGQLIQATHMYQQQQQKGANFDQQELVKTSEHQARKTPTHNIKLEDNSEFVSSLDSEGSDTKSSTIVLDDDGLPKHQLLYNNEVIFNPNDTLIPGTSAWKRQKLLERNRIAASKCRHKKKVIQEKLQKDVDLFSQENRFLSKRIQLLEKSLEQIQALVDGHISNCSNEDDLSQIREAIRNLRVDEGALKKNFRDSIKLTQDEDSE